MSTEFEAVYLIVCGLPIAIAVIRAIVLLAEG